MLRWNTIYMSKEIAEIYREIILKGVVANLRIKTIIGIRDIKKILH